LAQQIFGQAFIILAYLKTKGLIMKTILHLSVSLLLFSGCNQQQADKSAGNLAVQVQELKEKYRPGFGEYMIGIQLHHSKLWYAGINNNWKLADYEIGEIKESFESIKDVETDRPESKTVGIIEPAIASLTAAIVQKDEKEFRKSYDLLTAACNNCHTTNHYEFNVIITPTAPPVNNQDFTAKP
jgi:hypothetical protein